MKYHKKDLLKQNCQKKIMALLEETLVAAIVLVA